MKPDTLLGQIQTRAFEDLPVCITLQDTEYNVVWANRAYRESTGLSLKEIKGRKCYTSKKLDKPCDVCPFVKAMETGLPFEAELTPEHPCHYSGAKGYWLLKATPVRDNDARIVGAIGLGIDIVGTSKIQEELRISERRLSLAVSATGLGIYEHSINLGEDPYHSEQWARILGYELNEIPEPGSRLEWIFDRVHPEDVSLLRTTYTDFTEGRIPKFDVDVRVKHKSGKWIYLRSASEATERDRDGKVLRFIGTIQDITARKEIEAELIKIKKHLETAQEYAQFGSWEIDPKIGRGYWSDEVFRLHHLPIKDGVPDFHTEYMDCVHPEDREEFIKSHTRNIEEKAETRMVFRTNPERGPVRYLQSNVNVNLDKNNEIELLFGTVQDITERILQEKEYKELIDGMTETVWVIDLDGNLIDVNKSAVDLLGYSKKELLSIGVHGIDVSGSQEDIKAIAREMPSDKIQKFETLHRTKGGKSFPVEICSSLVTYQGKPAILSIARDITERKHGEEERRKLQDQLTQAQKMESIGRLAGGVAHDFNNMLSVIIGYAELATENLASDDPLKDDLNEILKAAKQSAQITNQLLAFARKQTVTPRVIDLNHQVESMLKMLHRLIGEDIDLVWKPRPHLWSINIDPSQIDQILANLCVNARDAIAGVGKLTMETANIFLDPGDCTAYIDAAPGEYVMLAVSDNGCGMDKDILDKLFEPFFTTKTKGKGTGLGLATIYGIVKQNNGSIHVYSEPDKGTTFRIYLPRHMSKPERIRKEDPAGLSVQGCETILLVEDEPTILKMTVRMLKKLGYFVIAANTPSEALRLARENTGDIHLLITDVVMPEMNGRDLAKNLLSLYPEVKCLFMSGYTANVIAHHGILDKGVHFIQKPFSAKELADKVKETLKDL